MIRNFLETIGEYFIFLKKVFSKPPRTSEFFRKVVDEMNAMGVGSLLIVCIVVVCMGSVITTQTALQIESPWIPKWTLGFTVRTSVVMELCPTIITLLLVGNLGSRITSEIGSMRVTEQIDALEVMGINPASFLILPKITAALFVIPILTIIAIFFALVGGYITVIVTHVSSPYEFYDGLTSYFRMYDLVYVMTKTTIFAFVLSSVSSFFGYRIEGGALELGKANVNGIVVSSFIILVLNLVITSIML